MNKISYSELIVLNDDVLKNVDLLISEGINRVELMMDGGGWDSYLNDYSKLIPALRARGIGYSVHPAAWDINLTAEMDILRKAAYEHHLDALEFSAAIGASQMVLHPGFANSPCFSKDTAKKRAFESTSRLAEEAKKAGVMLAFENVGYNGASIYSYDEYITALDDVDPIVGYLIDIGHAHLNNWDIPALLRKLASKIIGLHIHDNNGKSDQHLPIGDGNIDWASIYPAMKEITNKNCEFILEYAPGLDLSLLSKGKNLLEENVFS